MKKFPSISTPTPRWFCLMGALSAALALAACKDNAGSHGHGHAHDGHGSHAEPDAHGLERLNAADRTEVFVRAPELVAGKKVQATIFVTDLRGWSPVGGAEVSGKFGSRSFRAEAHSPGVYTATLQPEEHGETDWSVKVSTDDFEEEHHFEHLPVGDQKDHDHAHHDGDHRHASDDEEHHDDDHAHPEHGGETHRTIELSKRDQWQLGFGVSRARSRPMIESVGAWATVRAPEDARLVVRAPFSGRLVKEPDGLPGIGASVDAGDRLARLIPTPGTDQMAAARANLRQAELNVERAKQELERVERLFDEGALPERRLVDARHALRVAEARREAASNRLQQTEGIESAGGAGSAVGIRAPLGGEVVRRHANVDTFVEAGDPLMEIVSMKRRWLNFQVPATAVPSPDAIRGAWFSVEDAATSGRGERLIDLSVDDRETSLVTVGETVDPATQTIPVILSTEFSDGLRPGLFVWGHLRVGSEREQVTIPASSVVEQQGRPTVYVMTGGETFERRDVELGIRDAGWVGVVRGIEPGERVVSEGAYYVKLAGAQTGAVGHHH